MKLLPYLSLTLCVAATHTGFAQDAGAPAAEDFQLEEIIVTAQKRSQSSQDIPLAITAITGRDLQEQGIKTIDQIAATIPNVQLHSDKGAGAPNWVVRGVAMFDFNVNNNPATSIFIDEVYQSSTVMGSGALFDLQRVEVLKGPQGGLYGRNTTGGAVQVVSQAPQLNNSDGYASLDYGSWSEYRIEAAQNLPLSDIAALRVSAVNEGGDGWQRTLDGNQKWGTPERTSGRLQLLLQPTDAFSAVLKVFGAQDKSKTILPTSNAAYDADGSGAFCAPVAAGHLANDSCINFAQFNDLITASNNALPAAAQSNDGRVVIAEPINRLDNNDAGASLKLDFKLPSATLTSISAYDKFQFDQNYDYDATNLRLGNQHETADIKNLSQELRLISADDQALKWLTGINYAQTTVQNHKAFDLRDNTAVMGSFAVLGVTQDQGVLDVTYRQKTRYASAYGQVDYAITDKLNTSFSLRYSWEKTQYRDGTDGFPLAGVVLLDNLNSDYTLDDHLSGKASIDYHVTDEVMVYGSVARGYKSGGVFGGFPQEPADVAPYKEEIVWAYEAGMKSMWLDRRLQVNLAAFHYDHSDLQALTTLPSILTPGQFIFRLTNIGKATHDGVELETTLLPLKGLTLQASAAYIDAKVTHSDKVIFTFDNQQLPWQGRRIDFAPRVSASLLARYEHDLSTDLSGAIQFDYDYRSDLVESQTDVEKALRNIPGYGLLNGRLAIRSSGGQWSAAMWSKNLLDKHYIVDKSNDGFGSYYQIDGQPRSYGVSVTKSW